MGAARIRGVIVELTAMVIAGFVLALFGPFGTFEHAPLPVRLVYWCGLAVLVHGLSRPATSGADGVARRLALPLPALIVAAILVTTFPMTFVVSAANLYFVGQPFPGAERYLELYGQVALVAAVLVAIFLWVDRQASPALALADAERGATPRPRLFDRLPASFGPRVCALEMEDHYVRVHGDGASTLLLMRLRDAMAEMSGVEGTQIHRSWWVARDAVRGVAGDSRSLRLILSNGVEAPVARNSVAALRDAGWLDEQRV